MEAFLASVLTWLALLQLSGEPKEACEVLHGLDVEKPLPFGGKAEGHSHSLVCVVVDTL